MLKYPSALITLSLIAIGSSIAIDYGCVSWIWFQRSGSLVTAFGALLGIRSFVRLGLKGIGGASSPIKMGTITNSHMKDGKVLLGIKLSEESMKSEIEDWIDKISYMIGIIHALIGTVIWGYGDLLGRLF